MGATRDSHLSRDSDIKIKVILFTIFAHCRHLTLFNGYTGPRDAERKPFALNLRVFSCGAISIFSFMVLADGDKLELTTLSLLLYLSNMENAEQQGKCRATWKMPVLSHSHCYAQSGNSNCGVLVEVAPPSQQLAKPKAFTMPGCSAKTALAALALK